MSEITEYPDFDGEEARLPRYKARLVLFALALEQGRMTNMRLQDRYNINSKHLHHLKKYPAKRGQDGYLSPLVRDMEFENGKGVELTETGWQVFAHEVQEVLNHRPEDIE